jgi:hypothetical protein
MSGANNNTYAESRRLILGVGDIYLDGVVVGQLKGKVEFNIKREFARQRAGNNIADQKAEIISEEAMVTAEVCDLKLSQLRRALGLGSTVDTSTAKTVEKRQVVQTVAVGSGVVLAETPAGIGATRPAKVTSLDRKTTYVSGTDYKFSGTSFELISGGTITPGAYVAVEYPFSDAGANSLAGGGDTAAVPTFRMDYVIRDDSGKAWQLTFFKAFADTDFKIAFSDRESGDYTTHNVSFSALVDTSKPEGSNLYEIVQEDATA